MNGHYSINVPQGSTTLAVFLPWNEDPGGGIAGRTIIDVVLETELTGLQEVVVTAMAYFTRKEITWLFHSVGDR